MKNSRLKIVYLSLLLPLFTGHCVALTATTASQQDSVWLFSYTTGKDGNKSGLQLAWSADGQSWTRIGNEYGFLTCDYGRWGAEKRMYSPYSIYGADGLWHCVWSVNYRDNAFAHAASEDLIHWKPQSYPSIGSGNCLGPVVNYNKVDKLYTITYQNYNDYYTVKTADFKSFSAPVIIARYQYVNDSQTIRFPDGQSMLGQRHRVPRQFVDKLLQTIELNRQRSALFDEKMAQDSVRFAGLKPLKSIMTVQPDKAKPISDKLIGIFFEDINYAADGGLYAELIQNRDFEYEPGDKENNDLTWNSTYAWKLKGEHASFAIDTVNPIHVNNPHYAVLDIQKPGAALANDGFDGIAVKKGAKYELSLFVRSNSGKAGKLIVRLVNDQGEAIAQGSVNNKPGGWQKVSTVLTASANSDKAELEIIPQTIGKLSLDMISLFPQQTFKGRRNGLREDLAQTLADLHPRFVRFPGGCVAHGDGLGNIYRWKNSIGPLEARKPQRNLWGYHQTAGLGYYEYFQFCEDIGAEPLPVIAAGVPCQNSATGGAGQQGGIPMDQMDAYIQDILDLVEWANGDAKTTKWGKVRAQCGHPAPFHLKYIGIGNEDLISEVFAIRYSKICQALKKKYPEITIIGTVGPWFEGSDFDAGWALADSLKLPMVDEHYYQTPGWFIHNQDYYDKYDRSRSKVYLGEYAAHLPGRPNNVETALAEALHLINVERNGDVVSMASYAPLLAKEGHTQWHPDLIYFNNKEVKTTVGYWIQYLFGNNAGETYLPCQVSLDASQPGVQERVAVSVVKDKRSGDLIVKLVNLLPVSVSTQMSLPSMLTVQPKASLTVLKGSPADRAARPVTDTMNVSNQFTYEMPAYSFSLIRIRR